MNFKDIKKSDFVWLTREDLIDSIFNTFPSKIISNDFGWTVIESDWSLIDKNPDVNRMIHPEVFGLTTKVYFTIYQDERKNPTENFLILRGKNKDEIDNFIEESKKKNIFIQSEKAKPNGNNSYSAIVNSNYICRLFYSFTPIEKLKQHSYIEDKFYSLETLCACDVRIEDKNLSFYSDLLIGMSAHVNSLK